MTRLIAVFDDGRAMVNGINADAIGQHAPLPLLSNETRLVAAKRALAAEDLEAAERISHLKVLAPSDNDMIVVNFVGPPDWDRFGDAIWNSMTKEIHAVFQCSTMLVGGSAVLNCVGLPFENNEARRVCAAWCLENQLDDIVERVCNTPIGGVAPYCTWPIEPLPLNAMKRLS